MGNRSGHRCNPERDHFSDAWQKTGLLPAPCLLETLADYCGAYLNDPSEGFREADRLVSRIALERLAG